MKKYLPNINTIFRIFLVPVFAVVFFSELEHSRLLALGIFIIAGISDVVDGYIARKYNLISDFGKLMDPLADKLLQFTVALCVAKAEPALTWVVIFLFIKEITMFLGVTKLLNQSKIVVKSNWAGKLASTIYFVAFFLIMLFPDANKIIHQILCGAFVCFSVMAFIVYLKEYLVYLKKNK